MSYAFRAEVKAMAINTKNMTTGGVGNGSVPVTATAMMDPHDTRCGTGQNRTAPFWHLHRSIHGTIGG